MPDVTPKETCPTCGRPKDKPLILDMEQHGSSRPCPDPFHFPEPRCGGSGTIDTGERSQDFDSGMYEAVEADCPGCPDCSPEPRVSDSDVEKLIAQAIAYWDENDEARDYANAARTVLSSVGLAPPSRERIARALYVKIEADAIYERARKYYKLPDDLLALWERATPSVREHYDALADAVLALWESREVGGG